MQDTVLLILCTAKGSADHINYPDHAVHHTMLIEAGVGAGPGSGL
jgi:hypothetical protein